MVDNASHYSISIVESKSSGMFLGYYKPLKDSLDLGSIKIKNENIWYEKNWTTNHNLIFISKTKINPGIHFIVPYTSLLSSNYNVDVYLEDYQNCHEPFCFEHRPELGYMCSIANNPDTLILIFGLNFGSGNKDTIKYVRE